MNIKTFERLTGIGANSNGIQVKLGTIVDYDPSVLSFDNIEGYQKYIDDVAKFPKAMYALSVLNDIIAEGRAVNQEVTETLDDLVGDNYTLLRDVLKFDRKNVFSIIKDVEEIGSYSKYKFVVHERFMRYLVGKRVYTKCQVCRYSKPSKTGWLECQTCETEISNKTLAALPILFDEDNITLSLRKGKFYTNYCLTSGESCKFSKVKGSFGAALANIYSIF